MQDLASLGPFFVVDQHARHDEPRDPWRRLSALLSEPDRLVRRIESVRAALAASGRRPADEVDLRIAASVAQLGIVARVIAPALGATVLGYGFPTTPDDLWWQETLGGPFPLSVAFNETSEPTEGLLNAFIAPLNTAVAGHARVSARVLWGNVASALSSSVKLIDAARPDLSAHCHAEARRWRADSRLLDEAAPFGPGFRRSSCCLIYRLAPTAMTGSYCGDCMLAHP